MPTWTKTNAPHGVICSSITLDRLRPATAEERTLYDADVASRVVDGTDKTHAQIYTGGAACFIVDTPPEPLTPEPLYTVRNHLGDVVAGLADIPRNHAQLLMLVPNGYGTSLHGVDPVSFETMWNVGDVIGCTDKQGVYYRVERTR